MKVLHQAGHNTVWNLESLCDEDCGDGIIFSPVHYQKNRMVLVDAEVRETSLFDPQFYVPDSQKAKLNSYDFFPEKITKGFSTTVFEAVAAEAAAMCLDFQLEQDFESIVVPARYFPEMVSDYIQKQKAFTVEPFLAELGKRSVKKDVYLSLPVTAAMTLDAGYRSELLNWITSYPEIDGVYLMNEMGMNTKQIGDYNLLQAYIDFIQALQGASLKIIAGYCNTEAVVLSLLSPDAVTMGAYENTRKFSIDKFLEDDIEMTGPAPRLYFPSLLNWMRWGTVLELKEDHPRLWKKIYTPTDHSEALFSAGEQPHFTKPGLYKHHFLLINDQLSQVASKKPRARLDTVKEILAKAKALYDEIDATGVMYFDRNCSGDHLSTWNRIVKKLELSK